MGELRGTLTLILMLAFVALTVWIASGRNKQRFEIAARAPLEDDAPRDPSSSPSAGEARAKGM